MILPNYYAKNIFDVPFSFFIDYGFKTILCDLDNTLDTYDAAIPTDRVRNYLKNLKLAGLDLIIISNNHGRRVSMYANALKVKHLSSTCKPFGFKLKKFILSNNLKLEECILCGDQLLTDVPCGARAGIKTMLLDPISKKDQWTTRFNRLIDRPKRRRLIKEGKIKYLEEIYGKKN